MNKTSFWFSSSPILMLLIGSIAIVASLFLFLQPKSAGEEHFEQLRQQGITIEGKVVDVGRTMGGINGDTENIHETVDVEYFVSSKTYTVDASRKLHAPGWEVGQRVSVIYSPENPVDAFVDDKGVDESIIKDQTAWIVFLGGSATALIGFVALMKSRNKR